VADAVEVVLADQQVTVNAGEETSIGVTIRNLSDAQVIYDLNVDAPPAASAWTTIELVDRSTAQAFPRSRLRANLRVRPPFGSASGSYGVTLLVAARNLPNVKSSARVTVNVTGAAAPREDRNQSFAPPKWSTTAQPVDIYEPRVSPNIAVEVEESSDSPLPPMARAWKVSVQNRGKVITSVGFGIFRLAARPILVTADPPELPLQPGERASAVVTVQLSPETLPGTYPFYLRTYSFLSVDEMTELELAFVLETATPGPSADSPRGILRVKTDQTQLAVNPGFARAVTLTLQNVSGQQLVPELRVAGVPPTWYSMGVAALQVGGMRTVPVDLQIRVPERVPTGWYTVSVLGQDAQTAAATFRTNLVLEVKEALKVGLIQLSVDQERVSARPGGVVDVGVTILNRAETTVAATLQVWGIDASWVEIRPAEPLIRAQQQLPVVIRIRPPIDVTRARAGSYPITIQATSPQYPNEPGEARTSLDVELRGEPQLEIGAADGPAVREARYPLRIDNQSNAPLRLQLAASDPTRALEFQFDQAQLTVPEGTNLTATLTARARDLATQARSIDFTVTATSEQDLGGGRTRPLAPRELAGRFIQLAAPPLRLTISPPQVKSRDRGEFQTRVANPGATPATVTLTATDSAGELAFELSPSSVSLAGGAEQTIRLVARPKEKPKSTKDAKPRTFTVAAQPAPTDDVFPVSGDAALVAGSGCLPAIALPVWAVGILAGLAGIFGLTGFWLQLTHLPAVIVSMLFAFVTTFGGVKPNCLSIPAPLGKSIEICRPVDVPTPPVLPTGTVVAGLPGLPTGGQPTAPAGSTPAPAAQGASPGATPAPNATAPNPGGASAPNGQPTNTGSTPASGTPSGGPTATPGPGQTPAASAPGTNGTPAPNAAGTPVSGTPGASGGSTTPVDPKAAAIATIASKGYTASDPSTYGAGPLHVLIVSATGGDGHSQLAAIFYDTKFLGYDTQKPSAQIKFVGWVDNQTFVLRYSLYRPPDDLDHPSGGTADVTYHWNDPPGQIVPSGPIPPDDPNAPLSRR
jgi:uncharacterized membrane protein